MTTRGGWIWGRTADLLAFGGSALLGLLVAAAGPRLSGSERVGLVTYLGLVLAVDVAHVHTTLLRTYLDPLERRRHRVAYALVPVACYVAGVALHAESRLTFWRALAYLAILHFVRQQAGWVAIYRARAGEAELGGRLLDDAAVYAATLAPLVYWHAHAPRAFDWFVRGDVVATPSLQPLAPLALGLEGLVLSAYAVRAALDMRTRGQTSWGKHVVVATTALTWLTGIVLTDGDLAFTATNVLPHGVPYFFLIAAYVRERSAEPDAGALRVVARGGLAAVAAIALALAFVEELGWDRLVWHDHPELFGTSDVELSRAATTLLVPLLALPQATHYVLDALVWRRAHTSPAQARALGFRGQVSDLAARAPT